MTCSRKQLRSTAEQLPLIIVNCFFQNQPPPIHKKNTLSNEHDQCITVIPSDYSKLVAPNSAHVTNAKDGCSCSSSVPGCSQALKVSHLCAIKNLQKTQPGGWLGRWELEALCILFSSRRYQKDGACLCSPFANPCFLGSLPQPLLFTLCPVSSLESVWSWADHLRLCWLHTAHARCPRNERNSRTYSSSRMEQQQ